MKLLNTKTFALFLSAVAILSMSGCEGDGENGVASEKNLLTEGQPPIAQAGADRTIEKGDSVTLNGQDSYDPDGEIVSYVWSSEGLTKTGMIIDIDNPPVGTATVTLTVEDNDGNTDSDTVVITVVDDTSNQPPKAVAELRVDQPDNGTDPLHCNYNVNTNDLNITLDGSKSTDADGDTLSYVWVGKFAEDDQYTISIPNNTSVIAKTSLNTLCQECRERAGYEYKECKLIFNLDVSDGINPSDNAQAETSVFNEPQ